MTGIACKSQQASCVGSPKAKQKSRIRIKIIKSPKVQVFSENVYRHLWRASCIKDRRATLPSYAFAHTRAQSHRLFRIPIDMDSTELLMMAGFEKHVAEEIFALRTEDTTLIDTVRTWVEIKQKNQAFGCPGAPGQQTRCAQHAGHQWRAALTDLGMHTLMIRDMLNPKYDTVRLTQCSCYWVLDNVKQCFAFCQTVSQRIEEKEADDFVDRIHALSGRDQQEFMAIAQLDERTVFYKAGPVAQLQKCFNRDTTTSLKPLLEQSALQTDPAHLYLHTDPAKAILEAEYINHRIQQVDTAVLHIAFPNSIISTSTKQVDYDYEGVLPSLQHRIGNQCAGSKLQRIVQSSRLLPKDQVIIAPVNIQTKHEFEHDDCGGDQHSGELAGNFTRCDCNMAVVSKEIMECVERETQGFVWCSNITEETMWGVQMG